MVDGQSNYRSRALARPLANILCRPDSRTSPPTRRTTRYPMPRRGNTTDGRSSTEERGNGRGQDLRERRARVRAERERDRLDQASSKIPRHTRRTTEICLKKHPRVSLSPTNPLKVISDSVYPKPNGVDNHTSRVTMIAPNPTRP